MFLRKLASRVKSLFTTNPTILTPIILNEEPKWEGVHTVIMRLLDTNGTFAILSWDCENGQYYPSENLTQVTDDVKEVLTHQGTDLPFTYEGIVSRLQCIKRPNLGLTVEHREYI